MPGLSVPWFMVDYKSFDLILLPNVPLEIDNTKPISWTETEIPGDHTSSLQFSCMKPAEISFTIDIVRKNSILGVIPTLKQFEGLRVPAFGIGTRLGLTGNANPKVLFMYGSGNTLPQLYYVTKCDFKNSMYNMLGYPQRSQISMALKMDEKSPLYTAEKFVRVALRLLGMVQGISMLVRRLASQKKSPYRGWF